MKKTIHKKTLVTIVVSVLAGIIAASVLIYCFKGEEKEELSGYVISLTSLTVSISALIFSIITFYSIDSLHSIYEMDGNRLGDPRYSIAYREEINKYDRDDPEIFVSNMVENLMHPLDPHKINTCMECAEKLQAVMDAVIWLAYVTVDDKNMHNLSELNSWIGKLKKRQEYLCSNVDSRTKFLFAENFKLLQGVLNYVVARGEGKNALLNELEDIRIGMIDNPINQIILYDYLGLGFMKHVETEINSHIELDENRCFWTRDYLSENMVKLWNKPIDNYAEKIGVWIDKANECFDKAIEASQGNILWQGYLWYNSARIALWMYIIGKGTIEGYRREDVLNKLEETKRIRHNVVILMCENINKKKNIIVKGLREEEARAIYLLECFTKFCEMSL